MLDRSPCRANYSSQECSIDRKVSSIVRAKSACDAERKVMDKRNDFFLLCDCFNMRLHMRWDGTGIACIDCSRTNKHSTEFLHSTAMEYRD